MERWAISAEEPAAPELPAARGRRSPYGWARSGAERILAVAVGLCSCAGAARSSDQILSLKSETPEFRVHQPREDSFPAPCGRRALATSNGCCSKETKPRSDLISVTPALKAVNREICNADHLRVTVRSGTARTTAHGLPRGQSSDQLCGTPCRWWPREAPPARRPNRSRRHRFVRRSSVG